MTKVLSLCFMVTVFVFSSCSFDVCSSKRMYVGSYDQFIKQIEKKQDNMTETEWKEMDEKFERFSGECFEKFEEDLTSKERKRIMKHNFKYLVIRVKSELPFDLSEENEKKVSDFLDDVELDDIKLKGEELKKMWEELDKEGFKEAAEEFGKGFEKLEKAFEEMGKELKEIFEDAEAATEK